MMHVGKKEIVVITVLSTLFVITLDHFGVIKKIVELI
jgi:hypothetical protein